MAHTRVHVPIDNEARAALQTLADVRRCSLAAICGEMLEQVAPVALDMANALKTAQTAPAKAMRLMNDALDQQLAQADQLKLDMTPKATRKKYTKKAV